MQADEVHAAARAVLDFWFCDTPDEMRWRADPAFDREIGRRFGALRGRALASGAAGWRDELAPLLAAIVLLDQFSRNLHRGTAEAYAADPLAQQLTLLAFEKGWEWLYSEDERAFLYMPLMHAEDRALQALGLDKFATLGDERQLGFAREHAEVIDRFGRFPTRNAALGRESTEAESEYLSRPGVGW